MGTISSASEDARRVLVCHRELVDDVLSRYGAVDPRLIGSVARGEAAPDSDVDILVDLLPDHGNVLLRVAGLSEELSEILGRRVDVVAAALLREPVSATAHRDAVAL